MCRALKSYGAGKSEWVGRFFNSYLGSLIDSHVENPCQYKVKDSFLSMPQKSRFWLHFFWCEVLFSNCFSAFFSFTHPEN